MRTLCSVYSVYPGKQGQSSPLSVVQSPPSHGRSRQESVLPNAYSTPVGCQTSYPFHSSTSKESISDLSFHVVELLGVDDTSVKLPRLLGETSCSGSQAKPGGPAVTASLSSRCPPAVSSRVLSSSCLAAMSSASQASLRCFASKLVMDWVKATR